MKNSYYKIIALLFLFLSMIETAQVGIGTVSPNTSSMLDIQSTTKSFLAPRMTTAQRIAISSPEVGAERYSGSGDVIVVSLNLIIN